MTIPLALLGLSLSAFGAGFSVAWLLYSIWHRRQIRWVARRAYEQGQLDGYRGREIVELHDTLLAPAVLQARLIGLRTEALRWEDRR